MLLMVIFVSNLCSTISLCMLTTIYIIYKNKPKQCNNKLAGTAVFKSSLWECNDAEKAGVVLTFQTVSSARLFSHLSKMQTPVYDQVNE